MNFKIKEIERKMAENDLSIKSKRRKVWCHQCGACESAKGNKCSICYIIDIKDMMTPSEFDKYEQNSIKGIKLL